MVNATDIGQWVKLKETGGPVAVLEAITDEGARVCWGVSNGKRYEAVLGEDEVEVVPGRPADAVERTRLDAIA